MAKLNELWDPVPRRLIADMRSEKWTAERPAPDLVGWLWAFRQMDDGSMPSTRDLSAYAAWGNRKAGRVLNEAMESWKVWSGKHAERHAPHGATKRTTRAPPLHHPRTTDALPAHLSESVVADTVEEERTTSAPPAHHPRTTDAPPAHRRARSLLKQESDTTEQGEESGSPSLAPSPPPAEPSGSPSGLWMDAAQEAAVDYSPPVEEMDGRWEGVPEFQPVSVPDVFDDAHHDGVTEQPSIPRQIKSPATRAPEAPPQGPRPSPTRQGNGEGATGPAAPPPPLRPLPPPPPQPRPAQAPLWAAGERPGSGEGQGSPLGSEASGGATAAPPVAPPKRAPKTAPKTLDALALYAAWRVYHPRAAEAPTPDTLKTLARTLTEAGGLDGALLLIEWAHVGTCERARQIQGAAPWPDGRMKALWDLESLSRHVAGRMEMAYTWKDRSTDKATGLKVLHVPETPRAPFRGRDTTTAMSILADIARRDLEQRHGL